MKLFKTFISFVVVLILIFSAKTTLANSLSLLQDPVVSTSLNKMDTTKKSKVNTEEVVHKAAKTTRYDRLNNTFYLIGEARVIYQDFELDADYIEFNQQNNTLFARGSYNTANNYIGKPIFKSKTDGTGSADSLLFNLESKKLVIYGLFTEQSGGYFSGGLSKRQPDNEIHSKGTVFSTCNLPHPHFGIHITKGIVSPKMIITGPAYLEVEDIPLPVGIPFGFFTKPNKKSSGLIIGTPREDFVRGFMLENFGYYVGLSEYWDAKFTGTITTRGSYNAAVNAGYTKRYKYSGGFSFDYASTRLGLEGTPEYEPRKDFSVVWTHSQNQNARPGTTFSASVNARTSSYNNNTAGGYGYNLNQIAENALSSSISYGKVFGNGLFNLSVAARHSQQTTTNSVSLSLPEVSLNMSTVSPFANKKNVSDPKWYERLTVGYSFQTRNEIRTIDSLLFKRESLNKFQNGFQHNIPVSLPFNLFNFINANANFNYVDTWYLQTLEKTFYRDPSGLTVLNDTIPGFKRGGSYSLNFSLGTKLYSKVVEFKNLGNIKKLRHVLTPSIGVSYNPDFTDPRLGIYRNAYYPDGSPVMNPNDPLSQLKYSIFEQGIYGGPNNNKAASINFGFENTVELKLVDRKDTTGTGEKKLAILRNLTFNGSYNFVQKEKNLSNISFSGASELSEKLSINFNGVFSPYLVEEIRDINGTGTIRRESNVYTFKEGKLPRLISFGLSFDYSFNPESFRSRNLNNDQFRKEAAKVGALNPDQANQLALIARDPNAFIDFKIPWNIAFNYSLQYFNPLGKSGQVTNTLNFNGDLSITPKWKVQFISGFDFTAKRISGTSLSIYRDLHCWDLSANWIPFGQFQSYSIDLRVRASILQDLKLSKRKSFNTRY